MREFIVDLIARLNDKSMVALPDGSRTSEGSISVLAQLEADAFSNLDAVEPLRLLLAKEKKVWSRLRVFQLLASVSMNNHRGDLIEFIVDKLNSETSVFLIAFTLNHFRFYEKPSDMSLNADHFRSQLLAYAKSKDTSLRSAAEDFLIKFDSMIPKRRYTILLLRKEAQRLYKKGLPESLEQLEPQLEFSIEQRSAILGRLLRYRYAITAETPEMVSLSHNSEKEVFCEIHGKYVSFWTTDFNDGSLFEARQTPCEFCDTNLFAVFDVQDRKWV
jgi:hypothetical protein